jgi:hypothetical protein
MCTAQSDGYENLRVRLAGRVQRRSSRDGHVLGLDCIRGPLHDCERGALADRSQDDTNGHRLRGLEGKQWKFTPKTWADHVSGKSVKALAFRCRRAKSHRKRGLSQNCSANRALRFCVSRSCALPDIKEVDA